MRIGLLIVAGSCIALGMGGLVVRSSDPAPGGGLTEEARLALDIRCGSDDDRSTRECRRTLARLYRAGSLDPDQTLRDWCDAVKMGRWGGSRPAPPRVCVERYGGWREG